MNEIALRGEVVDTSRLSDLARQVREGHGEVKRSLERALLKAITVGELLLEAKPLVNSGEWEQWVIDECGLIPGSAATYMRVAHYASILPSGLNVNEAVAYLRGLPSIDGKRSIGYFSYPEEIKNEARRRRKLGHTYMQIGADLGIPDSTISVWCGGRLKHKERERQRQRERNLLRMAKKEALRKQAATEAKRRGGSLGKAYSLLRQLAQELDRSAAQYEVGDPIRKNLRDALSQVHGAERDISVALGVDYGSWRKLEGDRLQRVTGSLNKGEYLEKPCETCGAPIKYRSAKAQFCADCTKERQKESGRASKLRQKTRQQAA